MRNLSNAELAKILDKDIFHLISQAADSLGLECYVVGGYVRDLFLERPSNDIDVVVVGSGIQVASALKQKLGRKAHLSVFRNFGTAQVKYRDIEVEFVGARKESYNHDSRKPIVEDGTLEDDQNRRDFTINALAVCLNSERFGELVDPFDGVYDLEDGIVATPLDPDITFSDDPLRMMRCVRFATQLNFQIEDETYEALSRIGKTRLFRGAATPGALSEYRCRDRSAVLYPSAMDDRMRTVGDVTRGGCRGVGSQILLCLHLGCSRCAWTLWIHGLVYRYAEHPHPDGSVADAERGEHHRFADACLRLQDDGRRCGTRNGYRPMVGISDVLCALSPLLSQIGQV